MRKLLGAQNTKNWPKIFRDFWLKRPSGGWRTKICPKTGTGSSFHCHFGEKNNF